VVSSKWSFFRVLVVLIFVAVLVGSAFWAYRHSYAASNNTADVTTTAVSRGDIDVLVSATGVLEPSNFVDVGAQVSGLLDAIHVRVGEQISKDQLLAEIDPTIYRNARKTSAFRPGMNSADTAGVPLVSNILIPAFAAAQCTGE